MRKLRKTQAALNLPTLTLEGGLFLPDQLEKAAFGSAQWQTEADYGTPKGLKLKDDYSRAFQIACAQWKHFAAQLERADVDAAALTHTFVQELLRDVFGFTQLQACSGITLEDRHYPISLLTGFVPVVVAPHTLALHEPDTRFAVAGSGSRKKSAFMLAQELLNASPDHLWAIACNGKTLRLLRDAATLTRPSFVEIDLADLLGGQRYAEFANVWRLLHATRAAGKPTECIWEKWRSAGQEEGTRVREGLRLGVTDALLTLGTGFIKHPANDALRQALHNGELTKDAYFQQLLRLVYRLIFLFSAEERGLLHPRDDCNDDGNATQAARRAYAEGYALGRLRELCLKRRARNRFDDHWQALRIVFKGLSEGEPRLALPALGGLFAASQCPMLDTASLDNAHLLAAMQNLRWASHKGVLAPVDYRNMGPEELGSVYENLLEYDPRPDPHQRTFDLINTSGNERKNTGSYYTPDVLVQELIKSALDPVIEQRLAAQSESPIDALLSIRVIDPACGSGHFLLAAARRLAERLVQLRATNGEQDEHDFRHALRDVVARCIFGVDRNPMAVELARTALWLESFEEGRPLGFLDHHLQVGDALLGLMDLKLLAQGIPQDAFKALDGDEKAVCQVLTSNNRAGLAQLERDFKRGQILLDFEGENPAATLSAIDALPESSLKEIAAKEARYLSFLDNARSSHLAQAADILVGAFLMPKNEQSKSSIPTSTNLYFSLMRTPVDSDHTAKTEAARSACRDARVLHWPLAFPQVFASGGFDCVLGNPPWETMSPDYKEFFSAYDPTVRFMSPDDQKTAYASLLSNPAITQRWEERCRELYTAVQFIKTSGRYRLFAPGNLGKGDFNVYRMFVETALELTRKGGVAAQFVPEGLYNGANAAAIRSELFSRFNLTRLIGFENTKGVWFSSIHSALKFCLYIAWKGEATECLNAAFHVNSLMRLTEVTSGRMLSIPVGMIDEFSPEARAVMEFSAQEDIDICAKMYAQYPKFGELHKGLPYRYYMREVDMGTDRNLFTETSEGLSVFEGRMVDAYDYRAKGYVSGRGRSADWIDFPFGSENKSIQPQWRISPDKVPEKLDGRIEQYRIGFCDVASPSNSRSLVAALIPGSTICGHKVPTITFNEGALEDLLLWLGVANSLVMDFLVRKKVALTMSYTIMDSLPFPRDRQNLPVADAIIRRVLSLCAVGEDMNGVRDDAIEKGIVPPNFLGEENQNLRAKLAAEIDALVARDIFELSKNETLYILNPANILESSVGAETFKALMNRESREYGEYRTQRLVLEAWEQLEKGDIY